MLEIHFEYVRCRVFGRAERAQKNVSISKVRGVRFAQNAGAYVLPNERMILGDPAQLPVVQQVGTTVSDIRDDRVPVEDSRRDECDSHQHGVETDDTRMSFGVRCFAAATTARFASRNAPATASRDRLALE